MKANFLSLGLAAVLFSGHATSSDTFIFIDGHNEKQRVWVEKLNTLFLQEDLNSEDITIVDISESQQRFTGEFAYVHDRDGVYMATYLPRRIPEVVETQVQLYTHSKLEDFAAKLLRKIASNKE
ncbi:hypothetical protein [Vibrio nigripulchritudo]|uniref:hypothetical protein n=1 Tax=Vibrio nigripulchritudo TaxID=28173 RepID=UPI002490C81A|nr:hypothetical protein [Vibrio nigripulchritudo]BDU39732.1 hypothetical protein TUMSATVNIG2_42010 [Vibrio nigripulchritudo]BDU45455.1 hypothetical protein TUMSATVNIG3_42530 [Vibrio nigripulchritudo]